MSECTLIAEIGCNHMGDMDIAKKFIDVADSFCNVKHVKFQKRHNKELLPQEQYHSPHPVPENSFGETYGAHREYLEFTLEGHRELKDYCESRGMVYSTSVWDMSSLKEVMQLEPEYIKIPSATNTYYKLIETACNEYKGQIHISLGMTTRAEEEKILEIFSKSQRLKDLILYACTSGYPVEPEDTCLLEVKRLIDLYESDVHAIGFSGHHKGLAIDMVAVTLGAKYIERHFTLDRTWKGTDHAASLEPDGLRKLNRNIGEVLASLQYKPAEILPVEEPQRKKLKWQGQS